MFAINVVLTVKESQQVPHVGRLLAESARLSREEPGCLRFEVYHAQNEPRVYLLVERWESKESWEIHKTARAVTTIYQPQVLPLVERTPYFCDLIE